MTRREKTIVSLLLETEKLKEKKEKELLKFIHRISKDFDGMSPYAWEDHHGGKKFKLKIKKLYNK
jgi:hypothetical protein